MITQTEMMIPMLQACPSYQKEWDNFREKWHAETELPQYLAIADLVRHVIGLYKVGDTETVNKVFAVVERWHIEGDAYVKEAATIGFLEDMQNENFHEGTSPQEFEQFLGPVSQRWWRKVDEFWKTGKIIADDPD